MTGDVKRSREIVRKVYREHGWRVLSFLRDTACPDRAKRIDPGAPPESDVVDKMFEALREVKIHGRTCPRCGEPWKTEDGRRICGMCRKGKT